MDYWILFSVFLSVYGAFKVLFPSTMIKISQKLGLDKPIFISLNPHFFKNERLLNAALKEREFSRRERTRKLGIFLFVAGAILIISQISHR
jgi:hypothetical protein